MTTGMSIYLLIFNSAFFGFIVGILFTMWDYKRAFKRGWLPAAPSPPSDAKDKAEPTKEPT